MSTPAFSPDSSSGPVAAERNSALIGASVEKILDATLWRLRKNEITLEELTPALQSFFLDGHAAALASVLPELTKAELDRDQAKADADRLYSHLYSPREPIKVAPSHEDLERRRRDYNGRNAARLSGVTTA
jgi:hypothetical protein